MNEYDDMTAMITKRKKTVNWEWLLDMVTSLSAAIACVIILAAVLTGCATRPEGGHSLNEESMAPAKKLVTVHGWPEQGASAGGAEDKLGIHMEVLRLSAAGYILDFRFRVIDPAKAAPLLDRKIRPYLLDEASGAQLGVPDTAKLGQLRTTGRNRVVAEQDYFILFANPGRIVQAGNRMTLVMGDLRIENLTVE